MEIVTFKEDKEKYSYFDKIEELIKENIPIELLKVFQEEEFIKSFYVDSQAKYIKEKLNLSQDLDIFKTLIFCYNTNKREFEKEEDEKILRDRLIKEDFKEQDIFNIEELKKLDRLKVICVMDISKIGLMGSFDEKEQIEGKLIYNNNNLYLMPKRFKKNGYLIKNKFYYKEVK